MLLFRSITFSQSPLIHLFTTIKKNSPTFDQFKIIANSTQKLSELNTLFSDTIKIQNYKDQAFALVCRNASRIYRKTIYPKKVDFRILLNCDQHFFLSVNLKYLDIIELMDIVSFFSLQFSEFQLKIINQTSNEFLKLLMEMCSKRWQEGQQNHHLPYLMKLTKCAEQYNNPLYSYFLQQIKNQINQIEIYHLLSICLFILKKNRPSKVVENQINLMISAFKRVTQMEWVKITSINILMLVLNKFDKYKKDFSYVTELKDPFTSITLQVQTICKEKYKQMNSEQLIKIIKFLFLQNNNNQFCIAVMKCMFASIKEDGSTSINPLLIIRMMSYLKIFYLSNICPDFQEKFIKMIKYYLLEHKIQIRKVFDGLIALSQIGVLNHQNSQLMISMVVKHIQLHMIKAYIFIPKLLILNSKMFELQMYDNIAQIIQKFMKNIEAKNINQKLGFFFIYSIFNILFLKKMGITFTFTNPLATFQPLLKKIQGPYYNSEDMIAQLKRLKQLYFFNNKCKEISKLNDIYIRNTIQSLSYHLEYRLLLNIMSKIDFHQQQLDNIFYSFAKLSIPSQFHQLVSQYLQTIAKSQQKSKYRYFDQLNELGNKTFRNSTPKAQFFISSNKNLPNTTKFHFYSEILIINFLTIFTPKQFINELMDIIHTTNLSTKQYEYLLLNTFLQLVHTCDQYTFIKNFQNKIILINFYSEKVFNYFCHIFRNYGMISQQQLKILSHKQKIQFISFQSSIQLNNYINNLITIYQSVQDNTLNQQKILKFISANRQIIQNKQIQSHQLLMHFIRVIKYINQKKIMSITEITNTFQTLFTTILNSVNLQHYQFIIGLILANQLGWQLPQLFNKSINIALIQKEWLNYVQTQRILKFYLSYPSQNKWQNEQFIHLINRLIRLCPNQIEYIDQIISNQKNHIKTPSFQLLDIFVKYVKNQLEMEKSSNKLQ